METLIGLKKVIELVNSVGQDVWLVFQKDKVIAKAVYKESIFIKINAWIHVIQDTSKTLIESVKLVTLLAKNV